ncbi:MAG: peptidoglycan DD-metalloendopeptidase family protein [Candidatus Vogelbacteria bacterium]|nr:peptidoglycan DD-metalloendopeptidase family protein [Candidatus Vogelbacteria bacterium]
MPYRYRKLDLSIALFIAAIIFVFSFLESYAETVEELKVKIESSTNSIDALEKQISELNSKIGTYSGQAKTLKNTIASLEATRKKIELETKSTEAKITRTNLLIKSLGDNITDQEETIDSYKARLTEAFKEIAKIDSTTIITTLLEAGTVSDLNAQVENIARLDESLRDRIVKLNETKNSLEKNKNTTETERTKLNSLKQTLNDQKKIAASAKTIQETILKQTQNEEATYKRLLIQKQKEKDDVERELVKQESALKITLDQSRLPETKKGVLSWPLNGVIKITQKFGDTDFSKAHSAVYNGKGHNGIDLGGSIGTPILSAESGAVKGTGDTDLTCQGASYGKWVLVEHSNGLSSLYAHLSLIKVSTGQSVAKGQTLGYMGQTGYSTGPHLHFTIYATEGVKIGSLKSKVKGCGVYTIPIASLNAYLNPEDYL